MRMNSNELDSFQRPALQVYGEDDKPRTTVRFAIPCLPIMQVEDKEGPFIIVPSISRKGCLELRMQSSIVR